MKMSIQLVPSDVSYTVTTPFRPFYCHTRTCCTLCGLIINRFVGGGKLGLFGFPRNGSIRVHCPPVMRSFPFKQPSPSDNLMSVQLWSGSMPQRLVLHDDAHNSTVNLQQQRTRISSIVAGVLARILLSALLFAGSFMQPFSCSQPPAHAAPPPVDVETESEKSKDFYETLFEKLKQKDEELGRVGKESALERWLKDRIYNAYRRLKERKERYDAERRNYEEFVSSRAQGLSDFSQEAVPATSDESTQSAISEAHSHEEKPSVQMALEEKGKSQMRAVKDLTQARNTILEHRYLPYAVNIESDRQPVDEEARVILEILRKEHESRKKLSELVEKMVNEDIETEKKMVENQPRDFVFAPSLQRWRAEKMSELKQFLQSNPEVGKQFISQEQERILLYRDRVLAGTYYNEKRKEWIMSSKALKYAVDKELVESAQIRHDLRVMYLKLKGDDRIFFADLEVYDTNFQESGGFDELYAKMLTSGVKTSVKVMWIPLSQWEPTRLFMVPFKLVYRTIMSIWKSGAVTPLLVMYFKGLGSVVEEIAGRFVVPLLERLPKQVQIYVGLQLPDGSSAQSTHFLLELKKYVQKRMEERFGQGEGSLAWWISLPFKCFLLWIPFAYVARVVGKVVGWLFGPYEEMNQVEWKEKKGKELMKKLKGNRPRALEDPVRKAFDQMKRVKDPDIRLSEFAGLDTVKEEIKEIVTFLRDPSLFAEMGARPPKGVLIVGEPGTGKTSLAMAIAAEARVPLVEIDGLELEGGAWVGQGASNVRELFKTARELAPLIIFMDDFDYFAGVRGDSGDTRKQDHEALINQLLVELDGFETQEGVVLLATSSRPGNIDEALRRPGRIDRTITLPIPNRAEREMILWKAAKETMDPELIEWVDWKEIAQKTQGMTPLQLKKLPEQLEGSFMTWKYTDDDELFAIFKLLANLNKITPDWLAEANWMRAWKFKLRNLLGLQVTKEDVEAAVFCLDPFHESRPGLEFRDPGYDWTREFKYPHAVWAAGRGLVGALLPNFDELQQMWLDQHSWEGIGFTRFRKRREGGYEETGTITRSYYEKKLVLCFGSTVAACLLLPFGQQNNLSKHEIMEAQKIVSSMVIELGWGPDHSQAIYKSPHEKRTLCMGEELEQELEAKAARLFKAAEDRATDMIKKNRRALDALLEHLLEFDAISSKDISRILQEQGAIFEKEPFTLIDEYNEQVVEVSTNGTGQFTGVGSGIF